MVKDKISSRLGFILISAGCSIGCGNVWKFPWLTGENGGGAFVLLYIIFLIILGIPVMSMELSVGRAAQTSPIYMFNKLEKPGYKWHIHGIFCLIGNLALMAFYAVVNGWMLYYFINFLLGNSNLSFIKTISNPIINVVYLGITVIITFIILSFNLQKGLEKITKVIMLLLFILMFVIMIKSLMLSKASEGMNFYLLPDFSKLKFNTVIAAMNQAFFTLGLGIGCIAIFGSYIKKEHSLLKETITIVLLDTLVAIMAGCIIFPACFSYGQKVNCGPGLLFDTMIKVFNNMHFGIFWGSLFFLFMLFASMSTVLAVCENIIACVKDITKLSRVKVSIISGIVIFILGLTTALGFSVIKFQPFSVGSTFLDFWDFILMSIIVPLGSIVISIFCTSKFGWGWNNFIKEVNEGKGLKVKNWMKFIYKYIVPFCILIIVVINMINFRWK